MANEPPFDVWDGEELGLDDEVVEDAAEEVAMHVDPDSEVAGERGPSWSELTESEGTDGADPLAPRSYFADEQPDQPNGQRTLEDDDDGGEHEPGLEELLERQHYAFPATE